MLTIAVADNTTNLGSDYYEIELGQFTQQTTYKGYPLYYFFQDKVPGDTLGNKLGGVWFVVNPDSFPP